MQSSIFQAFLVPAAGPETLGFDGFGMVWICLELFGYVWMVWDVLEIFGIVLEWFGIWMDLGWFGYVYDCFDMF